MTRRFVTGVLVVGAVAGMAACTAKKQDAPQLSGPSELATAITMYASPDTLRQDGASQSQITVQARDTKGEAIRNLPIRLDVAVGGVLADYGQLSSKNVYTGSDGRATVTYTSPNAPVTSEDANQIVQILATPVGADYLGAVTRSVQIRLVPPGVITPPSDFPKVLFSFSPSAPLAGTDVTFDASASISPTGRIVAYAWDFGDGSTGSGQTVLHRFGAGGSFIVKLTVADDHNLSASDTKTVVVTDSGTPTADFVFSPTSPLVNQQIFFNASSSRAAPGRTLVTFDWNFGTDRTGTGVTTSKTYGTAGTYNVTLVVTDDIGKKGTVVKAVPVSSGSVTAIFTYSPTAPVGNQLVNFNASGSISLNPVIAYEWDFGDGTTATGVTVQHAYATVATDQSYVVRLTVRDNTGQFATTTQTVTVKAGAGLSASFTYSPSAPTVGQSVFFNGSGSSSGFSITGYAWDFGDGSTGTGATPSHAYVAPGTFVVRLTVTDSSGRTATTTTNVTVTASGGTAPTPAFTFSPTSPGVNESVFFNGSTSTPGAGHTIESYSWTFGDGGTATGVTTSHVYATAGTYSVQLKATDEVGQSATSAVQTVTVGNPPAPTAKFTFSPTNPGVNQQVIFDSSTSTTPQGQTITDYAWNFGDGTPIFHTTNKTVAHSFATVNIFTVNLTVTDSAGRTNSTSTTVTVAALPVANANFTFLPAVGAVGVSIAFDGSSSTGSAGSSSIVSWTWNFGDSSTLFDLLVPTAQHTYTVAGTYNVTLTVTDNLGRTGTISKTLVVQ